MWPRPSHGPDRKRRSMRLRFEIRPRVDPSSPLRVGNRPRGSARRVGFSTGNRAEKPGTGPEAQTGSRGGPEATPRGTVPSIPVSTRSRPLVDDRYPCNRDAPSWAKSGRVQEESCRSPADACLPPDVSTAGAPSIAAQNPHQRSRRSASRPPNAGMARCPSMRSMSKSVRPDRNHRGERSSRRGG